MMEYNGGPKAKSNAKYYKRVMYYYKELDSIENL